MWTVEQLKHIYDRRPFGHTYLQLLCNECAPGQYSHHFTERVIDALLVSMGD